MRRSLALLLTAAVLALASSCTASGGRTGSTEVADSGTAVQTMKDGAAEPTLDVAGSEQSDTVVGAAPDGAARTAGEGGDEGNVGVVDNESGAPEGGNGGQDANVSGTQVIVQAGAVARENSIVSFPLPSGWAPAAGASTGYTLRAPQGGTLPLQADATGIATFILPSLPAGQQATYFLERTPPAASQATATSAADGVTFKIGSAVAFHYQTTGQLPPGVAPVYLRGGYIHPVYTPSGALVTDDYPPDHRHHHGIWSAWTKCMFQGRMIDFWNMGEQTAKVDFVALDGTWDGPVYAGLRARHAFTDVSAPQPVVVLDEQWVVTAYAITGTANAAPYFVFDIDSTQVTATPSPLVILDYYYGGFGIRGNAAWRPALFLTSEGFDRLSGDGKTGRWLHIGGAVAGKPAGYAILGHPTNFRAPQPMRLNPTDPFMSFAPAAAGQFSVDPGMTYKTRFRFVVSDGPADAALLDRIWNDYATPPTVTIR
jgi:hypothetical protein